MTCSSLWRVPRILRSPFLRPENYHPSWIYERGPGHEANLPAGFEVHLVMDNYGTHKVAKVRDWLSRHPRALQGSLHTDQRELAEPGGAAVRRTQAFAAAAPSAD
jgi:hypothetical protein